MILAPLRLPATLCVAILTESNMSKFALVPAGAAVLMLSLAGVQAYAAPVNPNGSEALTVAGPNTVNTGDISSTTTSLTLSGAIAVGSFVDPFLSNPNNFCGAA